MKLRLKKISSQQNEPNFKCHWKSFFIVYDLFASLRGTPFFFFPPCLLSTITFKGSGDIKVNHRSDANIKYCAGIITKFSILFGIVPVAIAPQ